jgi:glycosyltransferase involved in cell wall biosynthesis
VITVSDGVRQVLLAAGVPDGKVVCVASGIDSDRYRSVCDRQWFLREFHLDESYWAIAIIGQLIPRKGHRVLLEALPQIVREFPNVRLLVFGHGPLQAELEETCRREALSSSVRFGGFRTDLERVLPCLDLMVHPAMMEGLGISLLEASAAGLPIVASRVGGIPEIVRDGVNGLLVPPGDARELARAILWLLREPERARALGRTGRELVQREFSAARMVEGNFQVYSEVLAARGARKGAESCTWIHP